MSICEEVPCSHTQLEVTEKQTTSCHHSPGSALLPQFYVPLLISGEKWHSHTEHL